MSMHIALSSCTQPSTFLNWRHRMRRLQEYLSHLPRQELWVSVLRQSLFSFMHQQKVNWSFTALLSFWQTFREFFDSRSRLTSKSRQEPGKVWKCRNLALCDLPNFVLFVLFEQIWVSCGSWELTKHTNKQQTLQKIFSQSPTQLTDYVHLLVELGLGLGLHWSSLSCLLAGLVLLLVLVVWYMFACWGFTHWTSIPPPPSPYSHFLTGSWFVIFP